MQADYKGRVYRLFNSVQEGEEGEEEKKSLKFRSYTVRPLNCEETEESEETLLNVAFIRTKPENSKDEATSQYLICGDYICILEPDVSQEIKILAIEELTSRKKSMYERMNVFRMDESRVNLSLS